MLHIDMEGALWSNDGTAVERDHHILVYESGVVRAEWWSHSQEPFVLTGDKVVRVSYELGIHAATHAFVHDLQNPEQGWMIKLPPLPRRRDVGMNTFNVFVLQDAGNGRVRLLSGPGLGPEYELDLATKRIMDCSAGVGSSYMAR
jgi:hypothetical protein